MASSRVKGITVQIGGDTTGLDKALKGVNKEIQNTQKDLKDVERLLKLDPTNTELLRQKQHLLGEQVETTSQKLEKLKDAEKQVQAQFEKGDVSEKQYNDLKREIEATEIGLKNLKSEAVKTERSIRGIDEKPIDEVADAADDAERQLKEAGKEASNFGDYLKAGAIIEGAKGIVSGLKDVVEESKEYMKTMGSLEVSSERAGYSAEETTELYKTLYGVLGDNQAAATTTANLQAIGLSQDKLIRLANASVGAWEKYNGSIPIDGLAEAINETVKAGEVTGAFADVLNWGAKEGETYGVKMKAATKENEEWNQSVADAVTAEDFFNLALSKCTTEAERANLIMLAMAKQGLAGAGEAWQENNAALVENNQANADLQEQIAELGEVVLPFITEITKLASGLLDGFNGLDDETQQLIIGAIGLVAVLGPIISTIGGIASGVSGLSGAFSLLTMKELPSLQSVFSSVFSFIASNPVVLLIGAIIGLVAWIAVKGDEIQALLQKVDDFLQNIFAKDWTEVFGPILGGRLNAFFTIVKDIWDSIKKIFDGVIDFIRGVFTGDWERAWNGVIKIFEGLFSGIVAIVKAPINGVISLINEAIYAVNGLINGFNSIGFDLPSWLGGGSWHPSIPNIPEIPLLAGGGELVQGSAIVAENGPELLTMSGNKAIVQPLTSNSTNTHLGGVNIVVYGAPGQSEEELADIMMEKFEEAYERKEAVYA